MESINMMIPISKENYVCVAQSSNCLVYLSKDVNQKPSIETVTNTNIHSKIASNELELTPVVRITPDDTMVSLDKPAIIELLKNIELSEKEAKNEIIPLCADSETSEWRELGPECNCQVHKDRISFEVTHFRLYTVISRKLYPSSTMIVKPSADIPAPTEVTIAELPGFKVQIPPCSVNADSEVEITATMLYDCPAEEDRSCLASSCIELEPHGFTFSKNVSISIPLPDYAEVMEKNPKAQLQVWHSDVTGNKQWNLMDHCLRKDEDGRYIAVVETNHFGIIKAKFKDLSSRIKRPFINNSFNIEVRCQVFMSQENVTESQFIFGIAVLFGPHKNEPDSIPQNYKHVLADSNRLDLQVSRHDKIQFAIKLNEALKPLECKPMTGLFAMNGRQQKSFAIKLDGKVVLPGGLLMGELSIGVQGAQEFEENCQTMNLIKPPEPSSTSSNLKTTYQFEESIVELEDSAERLGQDAIRYEESPGSIVEAAKKIASMWRKMAQLIRKECVLKERTCKDEIVEVAKNITKESQEVTQIATVATGACTDIDSGMRMAVSGAVERTQTISHQLRIITQGDSSRQRDEASDLEACKLLATNANNLSLVISEILRHTHTACTRIDEVTRKKLGLSKIETVPGVSNQVHVHVNEENGHQDKVALTLGINNREEMDYPSGASVQQQQSPPTVTPSSERLLLQQQSPRSSVATPRTTQHQQSSSIAGQQTQIDNLKIDDLADVKSALWDARAKWKDIGRCIGVDEGTLDTIKGKDGDCFGEMLKNWLRGIYKPGEKNSKPRTWCTLIEALREKVVNEEAMANKIEKKKYPDTNQGMWKLPGIEECGETSVVVHSSQGQLVEWNGLKLHIHAGSLPEGLQQCTIFIKASLAGEYEIPENTSLVSAIFWLRCEPQCTFIKSIRIEIQHCSTQRDLSKLKIVRALCSQKSLPYKFKPLKGGSFNTDTFNGAIDVKGFSGICIIDENPDSERMYYSQLFYRSYLSHQQSHKIYITFVWNVEAHINHISQEYPEDRFFAGCHRVVQIEGREIKVALDSNWTTVMDGQWQILPAQPMVTKAELDDFEPGRGLPNCMLKARPLYEDIHELLHEVILNGIKPPHHKVLLSYRSDRDGGGGRAHGASRAASATNTRSDSPPNLPTLLRILLPVSSQWMNIGVMLSLNLGCLSAIETRCGGVPDNCLREMLIEWLQQVNPPPTRSALVDAVEMYDPSLADRISAL